jgi:hypothetical protein
MSSRTAGGVPVVQQRLWRRHRLDDRRAGGTGCPRARRRYRTSRRDPEVIDIVTRCEGDIATQVRFLHTRLKQAAPQALLVVE